jgi:hypothetical protein
MDRPNHALRDEYNFEYGVRGGYRHFSGQPHTFKIRYPDGSVTVETAQTAVVLDPDVRRYFPNSEAVNKALRGLIALISEETTKSSSAP